MFSAIFFNLIYSFLSVFLQNDILNLIILNIIQILYFLRIYTTSDYKFTNIITRIITIPILSMICFVLLKEKIDSLAILWVLFIANLFINVIFTIKEIGINNLFPIGLLILFMQGISMLFLNLNNYLNIQINFFDFLNDLPFPLELMFYIPAQVVLTCSIFTVNRKVWSRIEKDSV